MNNFHNPDQIPLIQKTIGLYKIFYGYLMQFPKRSKYTLGSKCEMYVIDILELLLKASSAPPKEKLASIKQASVKLDTLKIFLRLAKEFKLLDNRKYTELQKYLQEIGRMLGGWLRSLK